MKLPKLFEKNPTGVDRLDYTITKNKNTYQAKMEVKIENEFFYIYKKSDDLGELISKLQNSIKNLIPKKDKKWKASA